MQWNIGSSDTWCSTFSSIFWKLPELLLDENNYKIFGDYLFYYFSHDSDIYVDGAIHGNLQRGLLFSSLEKAFFNDDVSSTLGNSNNSCIVSFSERKSVSGSVNIIMVLWVLFYCSETFLQIVEYFGESGK